MKREILFIQGGGEGGYEADAKLAASLTKALGDSFVVHYPQIQTNESEPDFGWPQQIGKEIDTLNDEVILVAHSLGASMLLKHLCENNVRKKIIGILLISTPFWNGEENWVQGLKLQNNFADKLPQDVPIFLYHCRDDEEVPFNHLLLYRQKLPEATIREIDIGGHQLNNDLTIVAKDIKSL